MATKKAGTGGPARKRGRPKAPRPLIPRHGQGLMAVDLFLAELALPAARGRTAEATRRITASWRVGNEAPSTTRARIKQAARLYPESRDILRGAYHVRRLLAELDRRMLGMPDDVERWLNNAPAVWILELLRKQGVDGTCPQWLVDAAHQDDWGQLLDLMSPK